MITDRMSFCEFMLPADRKGKSRRQAYRKALYFAQGGRCFYCKKGLWLPGEGRGKRWNKGTLDHFVPKSRGGPDRPANLVLACSACNLVWDSKEKKGIDARKVVANADLAYVVYRSRVECGTSCQAVA